MTQKQKAERLKILNQQCMECKKRAERSFEIIDPLNCANFCKVGREIHKLDSPEWDNQDWNSSKLEKYYHN